MRRNHDFLGRAGRVVLERLRVAAAYPPWTVPKLSAGTGYHERTVQRALRELEEAGYIETLLRFDDKQRPLPSSYRILGRL